MTQDNHAPAAASAPRVGPVTEPTDEQAELLAKTRVGGGPPANVFATMVRNPQLMKRVNVLGGYFMTRAQLSPRVRELAILRTAHRTDCLYEFCQHRRLVARQDLLGPDEVERSTTEELDAWPEQDRAIIDAVDELCDLPQLGDATWERLAAFLSVEQLLEVPILVGFYRGLAGFINSVAVQVDDTFVDEDERTWPAVRETRQVRA